MSFLWSRLRKKHWPCGAYWSFWTPVREEHIDQCILHLDVLALLFSYGPPLIVGWNWILQWPPFMIGLLPGKALCWGSYWHLWLDRINLWTTVLSIETFKNTNDIQNQKHPHFVFAVSPFSRKIFDHKKVVERNTCGVWRIPVIQLLRGNFEEERFLGAGGWMDR